MIAPSGAGLSESAARRAAASACGWCGGPIAVKPRGRIPSWCSPACRHRAWEQRRAAASGLAAVRVVERRVELPAPTPAGPRLPRHQEWADWLRQLAKQLDRGAVYDRDLRELAGALEDVLAAIARRGRRG